MRKFRPIAVAVAGLVAVAVAGACAPSSGTPNGNPAPTATVDSSFDLNKLIEEAKAAVAAGR